MNHTQQEIDELVRTYADGSMKLPDLIKKNHYPFLDDLIKKAEDFFAEYFNFKGDLNVSLQTFLYIFYVAVLCFVAYLIIRFFYKYFKNKIQVEGQYNFDKAHYDQSFKQYILVKINENLNNKLFANAAKYRWLLHLVKINSPLSHTLLEERLDKNAAKEIVKSTYKMMFGHIQDGHGELYEEFNTKLEKLEKHHEE